MPVEQLAGEAYRAYQRGDSGRAAEICNAILAARPDHYDANFLGGVIAGQAGRAEEAERSLRRAVAARPRSAEAHHRLGNILRERGSLEAAGAHLDKALRLSPDDPVLLNDVGLVALAARRWEAAAEWFARALRRDPGFAIAHYNLATALQAEGRDFEAIAALRRAVAAAPGLAEAHSRLGNLLHATGYHAEAVASFRAAAAARPSSTIGRLNLAKALIQEEQLVEAEATLRAVVAADPRSSDGHRLLGMVQKQRGAFADATISLERSIAADPGQVAAYHDLAYAKKLAAADRPLIARMEAVAAQASLGADDRCLLHFGLGKAYDDLGEHAEAIRHFDAANRIKSARYSFDRAGHAAMIDRTIEVFTADFFARNANLGSGSETPVLILGMMRSGTTLVEQIISSHPEVAAGGELKFWGDAAAEVSGTEPPDRERIGRLVEGYDAVLGSISPTARRVTDKMPHNFLWLGLIHLAFPRARIIHCRRNAVDTCLSIFFTHFGVAKDFAYDRGDIACFYQHYLRLMAHWRRVLPRDRFFEVDYEDLIADREKVTRELVAFCGLDWSDACLHFERNERIVKTVSMWQARQPIYRTSLERWRHYEPWLGELRQLLPPQAAEREAG